MCQRSWMNFTLLASRPYRHDMKLMCDLGIAKAKKEKMDAVFLT